MKCALHLVHWIMVATLVTSGACHGMTPENLPVKAQHRHALGVCGVVNVGPQGTGQGEMFPVLYANSYYFQVAKSSEEKIDYVSAKVHLIRQPNHGYVEPVMQDGDWRDPRYIPNDGFRGHDSFLLQVRGNGYVVEMHYFFYVTDDAFVTFNPNRKCKGHTWKIALTPSTGVHSS